MNCEYCKNEFKTTSSLNNHKNKSKYCLIIQGKIESKDKILSTKQEKCEFKKEKIEEFKCEYCNKILSSKQCLESHMKKCQIIEEEKIFQCEFCKKILSTKQKLEYHTNICDKKKENIEKELKTIKEQLKLKDKELKELKLKDKKLKEQLELKDKELKELELKDKELKEQQEKLHNEQLIKQKELKIELKEQLEKQEKIYKEQLEKQEEQNKILLNKLEILATKAIQRPTITNTTNNSLNIATSMDFDNIEHITNLIDNYLTINHVIDGQKGIANL